MEEDQVQEITITGNGLELQGFLGVPFGAQSLVLFAHGSGSGRYSPRNQMVARALREQGHGTLLVDLLTVEEEQLDRHTGHLRFDIGLLAKRLMLVTEWALHHRQTKALAIGYFGASTGAAAALIAAAMLGDRVRAVVSRGGRPDLAETYLSLVAAPTLLIVGSRDEEVLALNEQAERAMTRAKTKLVIVPGASHLFEEPGTLSEVADLAAEWFTSYMQTPTRSSMSHHDAINKEGRGHARE